MNPLDKSDIVDFHSHILPQMDDGSKNEAETLEMLDLISSYGVKNIVASPHFYAENDTPEKFFDRRNASLNLIKKVYKNGIHPNIYLGAEVAYFPGMMSSSELKKLCIEGTNYLLIEMPFKKWDDSEVFEIFHVAENLSVVPIIAHIERYKNFSKNLKYAEYMKQEGCIIQSNAEFFENTKTQKLALKLFNKGLIDIIGSDSHNMNDRKPNLDKAIEIIGKNAKQERIDMMVDFCKDFLSEAKVIGQNE